MDNRLLDNLEMLIKSNMGCKIEKPIFESSLERISLGAVWFGKWVELSNGFKFGNVMKPSHYAVISKNNSIKYSEVVQLSPFSSGKKSGRKVIAIPAGVLDSHPPKAGVLLPKIKLLVSRKDLSGSCKYKQILPDVYVKRMMEIINE